MSSGGWKTDVLVIGGGPAGLAAATAARLEGFSVVLAEKRMPPVDKACGEGIMPDGVRILERLGVDLSSAETFPFEGIRYVEGDVVATGRFPGRPGLGVRRTVLHDAMARRARSARVELLWGSTVEANGRKEVFIDGRKIEARWIVAADGANSWLRRALDMDLPPIHRRIGIRRHYAIAPWSELVEVHWSTGCEIYVTPVASRELCVAALMSDPATRLDDALRRFPALRQKLAGARATSTDLGSATTFRKSRAVTCGNVALVGDAAGCVDAVTGEGVTLGLHQALAFARAIRKGDLRHYAADYARLMRLPNGMTSMMLGINRRPRLRHATLSTLAAVPSLFSQLLALHTRASPWIGRGAPEGPAIAVGA
jgi:flavin-dependent dehydrogenase